MTKVSKNISLKVQKFGNRGAQGVLDKRDGGFLKKNKEKLEGK